MTDPVSEHKSQAPISLQCVVATISDTRTLETDRGGALLSELLAGAGHAVVARSIVRDEPGEMVRLLEQHVRDNVDAILMTGGTGISPRDQTYETVTEFFDKPIPGYGELFRMLSYEDIGPAAMLSRATAGVAGGVIVLTMPGSPKAVQLAMEKLVLPELPHLVREARKSA